MNFRETNRFLTARRNLCCNKDVNTEKRGNLVDAKCRALTAPWIRESATKDSTVPLCQFFEVLPIFHVARSNNIYLESRKCRFKCFYAGCKYVVYLFDIPLTVSLLQGVYTLEELKEFGKNSGFGHTFLSIPLLLMIFL